MHDKDCISFLQWSLPQLHLRWPGFRKVRRQVCKRIQKHIAELGLADLTDYRHYLTVHSAEWNVLDTFCYITISRFYRDRRIYDTLKQEILPLLAQRKVTHHRNRLNAWSIGCCSGEEPYTLKIIWELAVKTVLERQLSLRITATDVNLQLLQRAHEGKYSLGSLKELPSILLKQAFDQEGRLYYLKERFKENIEFLPQDIRKQLPEGYFDVILCRNLVFTYFDQDLQKLILEKLLNHLFGGGFLIIGMHEKLPFSHPSLIPYEDHLPVFLKLTE